MKEGYFLEGGLEPEKSKASVRFPLTLRFHSPSFFLLSSKPCLFSIKKSRLNMRNQSQLRSQICRQFAFDAHPSFCSETLALSLWFPNTFFLSPVCSYFHFLVSYCNPPSLGITLTEL